MLFKLSRKNNKVCIAGSNESNCELISELKELQSQAEALKDRRSVIMDKYRGVYGGDFIMFGEAVSRINFLNHIYKNVFQDIDYMINWEKEYNQLNTKINSAKRKIGIT